jgi:hypothetical protein
MFYITSTIVTEMAREAELDEAIINDWSHELELMCRLVNFKMRPEICSFAADLELKRCIALCKAQLDSGSDEYKRGVMACVSILEKKNVG